jgi:hypothetical protein
VVLIPDICGLVNFADNFRFDSVNMQAAHLIQMKLDMFKCLVSSDHSDSSLDFLSKELFGLEGTFSLFLISWKQTWIGDRS